MTRGRPRKTTAEKKANKTYRPDRDQSHELAAGVPVKPPWLTGKAAAHWSRYVALAQQAKTLTAVDGDALALLCCSLQMFLDAGKTISKEGTVCYSDKGGAYQHPAVSMAGTASKAMHSWLREFGMTPNARAGMKGVLNESSAEDPISKIAEAIAARLARQTK